MIDALWPTLSVAAATPRLHKAVHLARAALGDHGALVTANERIELWPTADVVIDVDRFEALAWTARTSSGPQELREAIDAYTGELLPDDVYEPWTSAARERLRVQYGELLRLAERWEQLIALDPTDEIAHLHIVRRLVDRRDRAGALRQLDHLTSALQRELDIEPSPAAQRLRDEVLALPIDASAPSAVVPHVAMPVPLTPLVGRMRELTELTAALDAQRLVTVTGPGGAGKTRLALAAIERCVAEHGSDAVFVDLARVTEPTLVDAAVADAAAVPEQAGVDRLDTVVVALADRPTVLLVDNCEHVQNAARVCIERLLVRCPSIRILATSRLRLMLPFEHVVAVSGLSLTGAPGHSDAATLFAQRMLAAGADPPADEAEWALVDDICRQLDGLALAIELAAGRVPGFGLPGLARTLRDQLDVLSVGSRDAHRHRSLATAIGWSYDLLEDHEQAVLRAAAVFVTPFDLDGVCAVTGSPPASVRALLAHLVDWHLVTLLPDGGGRYRILETIRQHAATIAASMGELEGLHTAHLAWCHAALDDLLARQPGGSDWRDDADGVFAETHAALSWATTGPGREASVAVVAERFADALFQTRAARRSPTALRARSGGVPRCHRPEPLAAPGRRSGGCPQRR
ncbi:MAG: BTAD domain-containing putative transcriptional regulator [Acidimicrobiia bacterium]